MKKPYCENCFKEELKEYIIDSLGSVFCNDSCLANSGEWRDLDINSLRIVPCYHRELIK